MFNALSLYVDTGLERYFYYLNRNGWIYSRFRDLFNDSPIPSVLLGLCIISFILYVLRISLWK